MNRIKVSSIPSQKPIAKPSTTVQWTFSFKYFSQIEYFGLNTTDKKWYVSLLSKLQELSKKEIEEVFRSTGEKQALRYHEINWESKNIPIKKQDLSWIDSYYLNNDNEFPFFQFQISKGKGRIVGFWNETQVFHIVLLDPLHNLQPARDYSYKVDDCYPLSCQYSSLLKDIEDLKSKVDSLSKDEIKKALSILPTGTNNSNVIIAFLDEEFFDKYNDMIQLKTPSSLLEDGILSNMS